MLIAELGDHLVDTLGLFQNLPFDRGAAGRQAYVTTTTGSRQTDPVVDSFCWYLPPVRTVGTKM